MRRGIGLLLFGILLLLLAREYVRRRSTFYEAGTLRPPYAVLHPAYYRQLALWIDPRGCAQNPGCTTVASRSAAEVVHQTAQILAYEAGLLHYFRAVGVSHGPDTCLSDSARRARARAFRPDLVVILDLQPPRPSCCPFLRRFFGYLGLRPLRRGYRLRYPVDGPGARRSQALGHAVDSLFQLAGFVGFPGGHLQGVPSNADPRLRPYQGMPAAVVLLEIAPCDADYEKILRAKWIRRWMMQTLLSGITAYLSRAHYWDVDPRVAWPGAEPRVPAPATRVPPP